MGQIAVSGTATLAAVGSTVLLNYCVTPYVHTLTSETTTSETGTATTTYTATTATMYGTRKATSFTSDEVVSVAAAGTSRPFCNFVAAGVPMYVHGELFNDKKLLKRLLQRQLTKQEQEGRAGE
jgi:hypothetical protein